MNFWHVTHPVGSGGSATELSVTDDPPGRGGDAMRVRPIASKVSLFVFDTTSFAPASSSRGSAMLRHNRSLHDSICKSVFHANVEADRRFFERHGRDEGIELSLSFQSGSPLA